ncbi:peptidase [Metakosakonia massiliensis]|uniref:Putative metallopeptidase domain-containing protein n=1 Tax=Phytobacter massiliensis TaxID=1485952 RepID=A0A6N3H5G2_9ENTR
MTRKAGRNPALEACQAGLEIIKKHALFSPLFNHIYYRHDNDHSYVSSRGWLAVNNQGHLWLNAKRHARPEQWARMIAQSLVALGFGYITPREPGEQWELAVLIACMRFCEALKIGPLPDELQSFPFPEGSNTDPEVLFRQLTEEGVPRELLQWRALYGGGGNYFIYDKPSHPYGVTWQELLAEGLSNSVSDALEKVGGYSLKTDNSPRRLTLAQKTRRQIMTLYPLLGALAASFDIEEDAQLCSQYDIAVAAIDVGVGKIWINPAAHLKPAEMLFVFAHELLHAGLNHASRRRGRDAELWNVACDFIINDWLIEMQIGAPPAIGLLYDARFSGMSAEEIYDDLAQDMRKARKLITLRGRAGGDIIGEDHDRRFTDAEAYCRRALWQGMDRCLYGTTRGTLPAGLIEEIRSLAQPPVPWDVALAEWFDEHFPPPERHRSYARPSRRQSATPDIPRAAIKKPSDEELCSRVFGVVLDTSGSMDPKLLGKALGAIASYALSRDVFAVRFICCDARAYDRGWVRPEDLVHHFTLQGRGGTVLQPGVELLNALALRGDFPRGGPVLVITDGFCEEHVTVAMEHAWLLPQGHRLPFVPRGKVFSLSE